MSDRISSENAIMEFLVFEAQACKDWIKQAEGNAFETFYTKVLISLRDIGIPTTTPASFFKIPLKQRLEELDQLEQNHRIELEAAFIATWLSKEMHSQREAYHSKIIKGK